MATRARKREDFLPSICVSGMRPAWRRRAAGAALLMALGVAVLSATASAAREAVRVGIYQNQPKIFAADDGSAKGLFPEVLAAAAERADVALEYVPCDWSDCLDMLEAGKLDIMPDVGFSLERAKRFLFSRAAIVQNWSIVYTPSGSDIASLPDLDGRKVAVLAGSVQETAFTDLANQYGIRPTVVKARDFPEIFRLLDAREVDAGLLNRFIGDWEEPNHDLDKTGITVAPATFYFAYSRQLKPRTRERIEQALTALIKDEGSAYYKARAKWLSGTDRAALPPWLIWAGGTLSLALLAALLFIGLLNWTIRRKTAEIERQQEELLQYQKMESIGQLTGGIAHDFNNLLLVISGNLEMAVEESPKEAPFQRRLSAALAAAQRGASLTHQLLAFARRQHLAPAQADLNTLVSETVTLLKRSIGDHVEISTQLAPVPCTVSVDAGQLQAALMNLAVNARDAMPDGGKLVISTFRVAEPEPPSGAGGRRGQVAVAVTDTGSGMSPDVVARAYEPFFTTKALGKGTGLGLSMVYGFARQSNGDVRIDSQPGQGTTVTIYLPGSDQGGPATTATGAARPRPDVKERSILLVEDDPDVRTLAHEALRSLGYRVTAYQDGPHLLESLPGLDRVDLALVDMMLPRGMSGQQVAAAVCSRFPGTRVLFVSGDPARSHERLEAGQRLLAKPFTREELDRAVRSVLEG